MLLAVLPMSLRCLRIFGFVSVAWYCDPTFIAYSHDLLSCGPFIGFCGLCGVGPVFSVTFARTIPAPVLGLAFRSAAAVAVFSPIPRFFALVLGISVLAYGILALPLLFLGYAYGVAFFGSVCLSSACLCPAVAGLVGFSCGPPSLVVHVCV